MRVFLITQDDPFYLADNLRYLLSKMPAHSTVVGAAIFEASPFGKKESFIQKAKKTFEVFGLKFFCYYTFKFLTAKLNPSKKVKKILADNNIPVLEIKDSINSKHNLEKIRSFQPDILVSILGNQIFRKPLIGLAPKGCINLHTALLPKYRGLMPSFWVLKNNEQETGVSVFFVDEGIDSGPIIVQRTVPINGATQEQLIKVTKKIGMEAIAEAIDRIEKNNLQLLANHDNEMTYYSFPTKEDVKVFYENGKRFF